MGIKAIDRPPEQGALILKMLLKLMLFRSTGVLYAVIILPLVTLGMNTTCCSASAGHMKIIGSDPAGRYMVEQTGGFLNAWHLPDGSLHWTIGELDPVKKAIIDPTGRLVVTTHSRAQLQIRTLADGKRIQTIDGAVGYKRINRIEFDANGKFILVEYGGIHIYSTNRDKVVRIWQAKSGQLYKEIRGLASVVVDPKGRYVAGSKSSKGTRVVRTAMGFATVTEESKFQKLIGDTSDKQIQIMDLTSENLSNDLAGHPNAIKKVYIDPNGRYVLGLDYSGFVTIWSVDSTKPVNTIRISEKRLYKNDLKRLQFDTSGQYFTYRGMNSKSATIWRLSDGSETLRLENPGNLKSIHFRVHRSRVISVSHSTVRIWNLVNGQMVGEFKMPYNDRLWIDPDGRCMLYSANRKITSVDLESGTVKYTSEGYKARIFLLAYRESGFAPGHAMIVARSADGWVFVLDPETGDLLNSRRFVPTVQGQRQPWTHIAGLYIVGLDSHSEPVVWSISTDALVNLTR